MTDLEKVIKAFEQCWEKEPNTRNCDDCPYKQYFDDGRGKSCVDRSHLDALELLKSMQGVPIWSKAEEPPKDDCECLVLTDDGLKFAEWRYGEWETWQADFINGGFVDDKWEKLPWTVKFWMYDIVV